MSAINNTIKIEQTHSRPFKLVIVGTSGSGKTAFMKRILSGEFVPQHNYTLGVDLRTVSHGDTPDTSTSFKIWDCAGKEEFKGLSDGYYYNADAAIVMFDLHDEESHDAVDGYIADLRRINGNDFPIVICGNKADVSHPEIPTGSSSHPENLIVNSRRKEKFFYISVKSCYNVLAVMDYICKIVKR